MVRLPTVVAALELCRTLAQLAAARRSTLTGVVTLHTRRVADVPGQVEAATQVGWRTLRSSRR